MKEKGILFVWGVLIFKRMYHHIFGAQLGGQIEIVGAWWSELSSAQRRSIQGIKIIIYWGGRLEWNTDLLYK